MVQTNRAKHIKKRSDRPMALHLVKSVSLIFCVTAFVLLYALATTLSEHAKSQLKDDLTLVADVIQQVIARDKDALSNAANVLARDFGFRSAVATGDAATIKSALFNHARRVEADLAMVMDLKGNVVAGNSSDQVFSYSSLLTTSIVEDVSSSLVLVNKGLYLVILVPVRAPSPVAVTLFGFEIDKGFLESLKTTTQLNIGLNVTATSGLQYSLSSDDKLNNCYTSQSLTMLSSLTFLNNQGCVYSAFDIVDNDLFHIEIEVFDSLERLFKDFHSLQTSILLTILLAIGASLIITVISTRKITAPLGVLAAKIKTVSKGEYTKVDEDENASREISQLKQAFNSMIDAIRQREAEVRFQAEHDTLTNTYTNNKIEQIFNYRMQQNRAFSAILVNIVQLRNINDVFGFHNGDLVVRIVAERIMSSGGAVARISGGTFIWLPETQLCDDEVRHCLVEFSEDVGDANNIIPLEVTCAHLHCPVDADSFATVISRGNIVLDEASKSKQCLVSFEPRFEESYLRRLKIVAELKLALGQPDTQFKMVYQPKLDLNTGVVTGAEALIRWINPTLGFVPPDEFIGIAEQSGLITHITKWVLEKVASDCAVMRKRHVNIKVAVNLSTQDILDNSLFESIRSLLTKYQLPEDGIAMEVTESDLLAEPEKANQTLLRFKQANIDIAMDDYGTGYSSLAYLKNLPINILKIDKSFVLNLASDENDQHIVCTTLLLAENLGLKTVAEGVEDEASLKLLTQWGCNWAQGYYISKPVDLDVFIDWIENYENTPTAQSC